MIWLPSFSHDSVSVSKLSNLDKVGGGMRWRPLKGLDQGLFPVPFQPDSLESLLSAVSSSSFLCKLHSVAGNRLSTRQAGS